MQFSDLAAHLPLIRYFQRKKSDISIFFCDFFCFWVHNWDSVPERVKQFFGSMFKSMCEMGIFHFCQKYESFKMPPFRLFLYQIWLFYLKLLATLYQNIAHIRRTIIRINVPYSSFSIFCLKTRFWGIIVAFR